MSMAPQSIGSALQQLFRQLGITKRMRQYDVLNAWESIVGPRIAGVTSARKIVNGVLFVDVQTATWRHELAMRKPQILERINKYAGRTVVKDIRFH